MCRERHEWYVAATAAAARPDGFATVQQGDKEQLEKEAKARYGTHMGRIASLEASLNANFDNRCDTCSPVGWPVAV